MSSLSHIGHFRYFLGIEISSTYVNFFRILLLVLLLLMSALLRLPMEPNLHLRSTDGEPLVDPTRYHHLAGSLVYFSVTHPDISHIVHILSQFIFAPTQLHYNHRLRILCYFYGTISHHLLCPRFSPLQLRAYSNAICASDPSYHRSLSPDCVFLGCSLIA